MTTIRLLAIEGAIQLYSKCPTLLFLLRRTVEIVQNRMFCCKYSPSHTVFSPLLLRGHKVTLQAIVSYQCFQD